MMREVTDTAIWKSMKVKLQKEKEPFQESTESDWNLNSNNSANILHSTIAVRMIIFMVIFYVSS